MKKLIVVTLISIIPCFGIGAPHAPLNTKTDNSTLIAYGAAAGWGAALYQIGAFLASIL